MMDFTHISQIRALKPENVAFISYVMNQYVKAPYETLVFTLVDEPFLKARAAYMCSYGDESRQNRVEFWIIEAKAELTGMAIRVIENGKVMEDQISFINFVIRPYHQECVVEATVSLPIYA